MVAMQWDCPVRFICYHFWMSARTGHPDQGALRQASPSRHERKGREQRKVGIDYYEYENFLSGRVLFILFAVCFSSCSSFLWMLVWCNSLSKAFPQKTCFYMSSDIKIPENFLSGGGVNGFAAMGLFSFSFLYSVFVSAVM